ncbi:MAG: RNA methyltransferase [Phycisphaerae bacterium]|nr:RNA methyltransferase [Phycisphaerae bacterium]
MNVVELSARASCNVELASLLPPDRTDLRETLGRYDDVRDRDLRGRDRRFLVESERCVRRFLRAQTFECESLLLTRRSFAAIADDVARHREIDAVFLADDDTMTTIAGYRLHGGALAIGRRGWRPPDAADLIARACAGSLPRLVVAEGVDHVDNLGSIVRSAACLGWSGLVLDERCADPLLRKTIRFSMGRVFEVPWGFSRDLRDALDRLRTGGVTVVGLELAPRAVPLSTIRVRGPIALVVGSEAHGISAETLARCDIVGAIPVAEPDGEARSLNVGVAAGIALYELSRPHSESA